MIKICDKYLADELSKEELIHFATTVMFDEDDKYDCEDDVVEEILSQWDSAQTQSKINETSIRFFEECAFRKYLIKKH